MSADFRQQEENEQHKHAASMDGFIEWLYENYAIPNGHKLVDLQEDGDIQAIYLAEVGLHPDTELEY
jgi:hypothetical protein